MLFGSVTTSPFELTSLQPHCPMIMKMFMQLIVLLNMRSGELASGTSTLLSLALRNDALSTAMLKSSLVTLTPRLEAGISSFDLDQLVLGLGMSLCKSGVLFLAQGRLRWPGTPMLFLGFSRVPLPPTS